MATMSPVHSTLASEETNPKYHTNNECPHYHELKDDGHVAQGRGGLDLCDWCADPPKK
jgi:hypothetical protein